ncbi:RHS repeat domain-containing protein, partial [Treponema pedis]|uniref:RHS repeat domain-containing protein n=1 Tax=Treponema pedis TaxID=409322 RepID=UPI00056F5DFF
YHSDHLGSAQFVTDWRGKQYEHIEYTPYGELWVEETAPGIDKLPFRFTGKELDEETGLYYYGARYLDPKYSRWLSGDPALGEYIPSSGTDPSKLAGMGGVFNVVNLHVYHYAGNNPVKYIDPDGRDIIHLLDPDRAIVFGHSAALIGNDTDGWLYYSNDGDKSTTVAWFANLDEFQKHNYEPKDKKDNEGLGFNYKFRKRVETTTEQDKKMQDKAISLTNLTDAEVKSIKDGTTPERAMRTEQDKNKNIKKNKYRLFSNNCSQNVGKIAEAGGLVIENSLIPKEMDIMTKEEFLLKYPHGF